MKEISAEIKGHFLRLYQMAMTDGDFSSSEWKMLYLFAEERGVAKSELDEILLNTSGKIEVPSTIENKIEYLYDLAQMILADEIVTEEELHTLKKYCKKFGFIDENIDELADYLISAAGKGISKFDLLKELT